jgi:hypothetical protein
MYYVIHIDDCHINPEAAQKLAQGDWPNLEKLILCNDIFMKGITNNLEMKDVNNSP